MLSSYNSSYARVPLPIHTRHNLTPSPRLPTRPRHFRPLRHYFSFARSSGDRVETTRCTCRAGAPAAFLHLPPFLSRVTPKVLILADYFSLRGMFKKKRGKIREGSYFKLQGFGLRYFGRGKLNMYWKGAISSIDRAVVLERGFN